MLSPMPPLAPGSGAERLVADPPAFDRAATLPRLQADIADFYARHLGSAW